MPDLTTNTLVIGAGPAGLAVGACLKKSGVPHAILEATNRVGTAWRNHYDRLHLHTDKNRSRLPFVNYPKHYPRYPSRDQVVEYLDRYADQFGLKPIFGETVTASRQTGEFWETTTRANAYTSKNVVFCTGYARKPILPVWPGLERFPGTVMHSSIYTNGRAFDGRRALVVGFGNSGGEIAIDLCEHGATTDVAVRSPVNVIPREVLGLPILALAGIGTRLPPQIADRLNGVILNRIYSDLEDLGFRRLPYGPLQQVRDDRRVPLIDIGTIDLIRDGCITVRPASDRFDGEDVVFTDGGRSTYDVVILATGYRPGLGQLLPEEGGVLIDGDRPVASGAETSPGLYFCGLHVSPGGMLQQINKESRRIAKSIAGRS